MERVMIVVLIGAVASATARAQLVIADSVPRAGIVATGRGEVTVEPTRGTMVFDVVARGTQPEQITAQLWRRVDSVSAAVRQVSAARVETKFLALRNARWFSQRIDSVGFEARAQVRVPATDVVCLNGLREVSRIAAAAMAAGGAEYLGIEFTAAERERARAAAVDAAMAQSCATAMRAARAGNMTVGNLLTAHVSVDDVGREGAVVYNPSMGSPLAPAALTARAAVTVTWSVRARDGAAAGCAASP